MVVRIHGLPVSTCTQTVLTVLKELNVPYELVPVDVMGGEHKKPEYLENMHPFGQIPVLVSIDSEFSLCGPIQFSSPM